MVEHLGLFERIIHITMVVHRGGNKIQTGLSDNIWENVHDSQKIEWNENVIM